MTALAAAVVLLALASCSDDPAVDASGGNAPTEERVDPTTLPLCSEERHIVVLDFFGTLTMNDREQHEAVSWIQDPSDEPRPRPGGAELAHAYRDLGYDLLVVHLAPEAVLIGDLPFSEAIAGWLERHEFPATGIEVSGWDDTGFWDGEEGESGSNSQVDMVDTLLKLSLSDGVSLDAGYTSLGERALGFKQAGVPSHRVFGLKDAADLDETVAVRDDDLEAHAAGVVALEDEVCRE